MRHSPRLNDHASDKNSLRQALNTRFHQLMIPIALTLVTALLQWCDVSELLRYDRQSVMAGQAWRLLSAHLIHLSWSHWGLNMLGTWMVLALFAPLVRPKQWLVIIFICCLTVTISLLLFSPRIAWFVGFSGVLHGCLMAGALIVIKADGKTTAIVIVGLAIKLLTEQFISSTGDLEALIGGNIVRESHLYGAFGGVIAALYLWIAARVQKAAGKPSARK